MSTIVRTSHRSAGPSKLEALAPRAVRLRNVLLQHIAVHRGLRMPNRQELSQLGDQARLGAALEWWENAQRKDRPLVQRRPLTRAAFIAALVVLGLALFATPVQ
jgi:hypothetical protein